MLGFDDVFPETAAEESLILTLPSGTDGGGTFLVREAYCTRPRCNCRSVALVVVESETRRPVAVAHYSFELTKGKPSAPVLDPDSRGPLARMILEEISRELRDQYRLTLLRHYASWRSAVDDRSHPAYAVLRELTAETRPKRSGSRARPKPVASSVEIELVQRARTADTKAQKKFATLVRKVESLRTRVQAWRDDRPTIDRSVALYQAEFATQRDLARQFVVALDTLLVTAKLSKAVRKKLARLVCSIAPALIEDGFHELKPIYDRYAGRSYDVEAVEQENEAVASIKAMMEVMGLDIDGTDIRSFGDLAALAERERQKLDDAEARADRRRATRKRSKKQLERDARAQTQERDASKAIQDVYRKLAMAFHPDLERDDSERARKTALMQEVNTAYEKNDLLRLLELQLKLENVDANARDIAEDRLVHYMRILDDQARELARELDGLELPFRVQLDRPPPTPISPRDVIAVLHRDTEDLRETIAMQREDLVAIADPTRRQAWLRRLPDPRRGFEGEIPY